MMTTVFIPHRKSLLALRARLRGDVDQMANNALTAEKTTRRPMHMAELGSDSFDRELTLSLLGSKQAALDQVEAAIARIEKGSYGQCETCGGRISKIRLQAIPYANQCMRCAAEQDPAPTTLGLGRGRHRLLPR
jgi:RNA polymerase-binding transcription factor DksA